MLPTNPRLGNHIMIAVGILLTAGTIGSFFSQGITSAEPSSTPHKTMAEAEETIRKKTTELVAQGWASGLPQAKTLAVMTGAVASSHGRSDGIDVFMIHHGDSLHQCEVQRRIPSVRDPSGGFYPPISGQELRLPVCWKLS